MPTDPFLPEGRNFPRNRSPDAGGSDRKRRRKVLSCYDCRRRKLQCDRQLPSCGRCTKAGQAANCLYLEDAADAPIREPEGLPTPASSTGKLPALYGSSTRPIGVTAPTGDLLSRLEFQDGRIKQLEAALVQAGGNAPKGPRLPPTPESMAAGEVIAPVQDRESTLLRGRSFKTQFHGNTHPGALIARIPELHGFTRETFESFPALSRIKEDMGSLETRRKDRDKAYTAVSDSHLRDLLPPKDEADSLVQIYLDNYGALYDVLHLPSFWEEYNKVWPDVSDATSGFVALLLVMMGAAQCLTSAQPWLYNANSSLARERAISMIQSVENWLTAQSQKHVTAIDFQIRIVLLIARQVAARKFKRTWTEAGSVLRFCMAAGLHRTPELIRKPTSLLDKELRKRVWAAVAELELQAAFDRGMVSTPWHLQSDCPPPSHLNEDDLDSTSEHLPAPRRHNEFTNSSYLCLSAESLMLRQSLNTYLNNIRQPVHFDESKRYTEEIELHLSNIPDWIGSSSDIPKAMLSLNLRQYLLVLHDRQLRVAESKAERDFSRMVLIDTASSMIETHKSLTSKGIYALELLCQDQLRAALSLCHIASFNPTGSDALSRAIDEAANRLIPDAIEMLTDKVIRFGREQRQLWILLAANGFMKSKKDSSKRIVYMQEAVDKITRPYYKIMACQEDAPTTQVVTTTPQTQARKEQEMRAGMLEYYPPSEQQRDGNLPPGDQPMLDLDEIAAWTFEDWNFNPADLAAAFPDGMGGYSVPPTATTPYPNVPPVE